MKTTFPIYKLRQIFLLAVTAVLLGCAPKQTEIVIISTNDIHGAIENMPALATLVDRYRGQSDYVLLIDAGDKWTGNPYVDLYNPKGAPMVELMNDLKYDLATVGNHGFDNGLQNLSDRIRSAGFQTVLANVDRDTTGFPQLPAYVFKTVDGVKLCFLGLLDTSREGHPDGKLENFGGVVFSDPIETALKYRNLRDSCDVLIGLTHIGMESDSVLAMQMPQLDLIIGGHSHTVLPEGRMINDVLVTQAGKSLQYAGVTRLRFKKGKLVGRENALVALDTVARSGAVEQKVDEYKHNPDLQRVIGSFAKEMNRTALLNFMTDAIKEGVPCDFVFCNWNNVRIDHHDAGDFTVADLFGMEPFRGTVYVLQMTAGDMRDLILTKFNTPGKEGYTVDLSPAGMSYTIETDKEGNGVDVAFFDLKGRKLPYDAKKYRVALSDYVNATYTFPLRGTGVPTDLLVTDLMTDCFKKHSPVDVSSGIRVQIAEKGE